MGWSTRENSGVPRQTAMNRHPVDGERALRPEVLCTIFLYFIRISKALSSASNVEKRRPAHKTNFHEKCVATRERIH
jgi:hypothetical protein